MIKRLVFGVAAGALALAPLSVRADWYVNPELNVGVGLDSGVGSGILEGHVGYDFDNGAYIQAGPALIFPDAGEKDVEFTGKLVSAAVLSMARFRLALVMSWALVSRPEPSSCLLYTSPSPRDKRQSRMPSSA